MAVDESFKRPGTVPFKWEVQPGIPKPEPSGAGGAHGITAAAPPRLAPPPAARVGSQLASASCRRTGFDASVMPLSPPPPPKSSHRRSMSARFATSLVMLPFARRSRRSRTEDDAEFCLLFGERIA